MALALLVAGWRGRRVGDHPYCRRCGFDLFGRATGSTVCSECGAELNRARAVVVGVRTPRWRVAWAGIALLVPGAVVAGLIGYGTLRGVDWQKQKPAWWLTREAESNDVATRDAALSELIGRFSAGTLTPPQVEHMVTRGLKLQRNLVRPWPGAWGNLIERVRLQGYVSDDQWKIYRWQSWIRGIGRNVPTRQNIADAIHISHVRVLGSGVVLVQFRYEALPVDMSFDVFVRAVDREWPAGTITCRAAKPGSISQPWTAGSDGADELQATGPDRVDVILRPSGEEAKRWPEIMRSWRDEVVFRDVPVLQQGQTHLRGSPPSNSPRRRFRDFATRQWI